MKKILQFACIVFAFFMLGCSEQSMEDNRNVSKGPALGNKSNTQSAGTVARVNLFVENSGSMLGYVRQGNEFDRAISSLLTEFQVQNLVSANGIHKYYINSKPFEQKNVSVDKFIKGMTLRNATTYKGNSATTSICALLDTVFRRTTANAISIFVSDCIISPGKGNDASKFVGSEKDAIKLLANKQCSNNKAVVVYRLMSSFNGKFYDCQDNFKQINTARPFFIWVIGSKSAIENYLRKVPDSKIEGEVLNRYVYFKVPSQTPKYVIQSLTRGEEKDIHSVVKAKLDADNKSLRIRIAVDYSSLKLLDKYLLDVKNYTTSNKLYKVEKIEKKAGAGTTHVITLLTTTNVSPTSLTITLKNKLPDWVETYSIPANQCDQVFKQLDKTFAFADIMRGMYQGYNQTGTLAKLTININK